MFYSETHIHTHTHNTYTHKYTTHRASLTLSSPVAARFEGHNGKVTKVVLDDKTELPADLVVMGAGVVPNTQIVKGLPLNKDVRCPARDGGE